MNPQSAAIGLLLLGPAIYGQAGVLDKLAGQDLRNQPASALSALDRMAGYNELDANAPSPWYVWKIDRAGKIRYVVFCGAGLFGIPGMSRAEVRLYDSKGKPVARWPFQVGWRINLSGATFAHSENLKSDLIILETQAGIDGLDIAKEYFAIEGDRLRLVRLEDSHGAAAQNDYVYANQEIGVEPEAKDVGQITRLLESKDKAEVLSTLVFLGGSHEDKGLFHDLMENGRVHELIVGFESSDDLWVREAAALAARPLRDRPLH